MRPENASDGLPRQPLDCIVTPVSRLRCFYHPDFFLPLPPSSQVAGPCVFLGYHNKPAETADAFAELHGTR